MPANKKQPRQPSQPSSSSVLKATAKYTNKDGTKYISVPKSSASTPPAQPSPTTEAAPPQSPTDPEKPAPVNRKKQKRRAKAAEKLARAEQAEMSSSNGIPDPSTAANKSPPPPSGVQQKISSPTADGFGDETESEHEQPLSYALVSNGTTSKSKKARKKKKKGGNPEPDPIPRSGTSNDKIWNTSAPEEREEIKKFWLGLGEEDRKSLVKVEKDAVLRKMKEQQKHTCSCSVCGRKRTAIEEELEGLYDAYYRELEQYANDPHKHPNTSHMFAATKKIGEVTGLHKHHVLSAQYSNQVPSQADLVRQVDNEDDEDDIDDGAEYSEEEEELDDEDEEDEEDEPLEMPRESYENDFLNFGQSLTVKGGILTVADDLLKNDGKKFIEMMEQLAERRMQREEDAKDHFANPPYGHAPPPVHGGTMQSSQNQPPPEEDDYDDEEEEGDMEEYDSQEEEYDDEELQEDMTEEQRMEEGRRMFQIFAARMFEQRVLTAYREKVAFERQNKLLEEIVQEDLKKKQQAEKKAKEAQKKKDKAAQKKAAQQEEKQRKEAAKAEEEARRQAAEKANADELQRKAEERRKKKDAQKKAEDEERLKKETEKQRRAQEQRKKHEDQERRAREQKDKEKKAKEERQRKELEARELKERETRERREKHEKDKREKELRAAQAKADRDAKEKQKQEGKISQKAATTQGTPVLAQPSSKKQPGPASMAALPHHPGQPSHHASPQISVATPVLPKAQTPMKPRAVSHEVARSVSQTSHPGSGLSQTDSSQPLTPVHMSPGPIRPPSKASSHGPHSAGPSAQSSSPMPGGVRSPPGFPQHGTFANMGMPPPPGLPMGPPGLGRPMPDQMFSPMYPGFGGMNAHPPGLPNMSGRPFPPVQPPLVPGSDIFAVPDTHHAMPRQASSHSRQASASFEATSPVSHVPAGLGQAMKPNPIGRPPSVAQGQRTHGAAPHIDDVSEHLGSSALLGGSEDASFAKPIPFPRGTGAAGSAIEQASWGTGTSPLGNPWGLSHQQSFPSHQPDSHSYHLWRGPHQGFNLQPTIRSAQPRDRTLMIRQMLVQSCRELQGYAADNNGYIDLENILHHIALISTSEPATKEEILAICETEGNPQNGGGTFYIRHDSNEHYRVRFEQDAGSASSALSRNVGAPGQLTSPVVGTQAVANRF